ncbi:hypothetical protein [Rugosimonospora africana]|uniref:WXG100 family type VII secretion target n=1 Tax=Rugosimonospora africana TaxID=556532 RepID=A0A8J3VUC6_9ACTN|nr:hypothetical protein [Rugosimonospora africana]GIH18849.1 hypothetical protein Raf01_70210 [Rugosimonospora africana]
MSGFTTNTNDLQSTAPQYDSVADQVRQIYTTLTDALNVEGACWGSDDAGKTFGGKYVSAALPALQQLSATNDGLQSMVDGICSWAKNYLNADDAAQQSASQISSDS